MWSTVWALSPELHPEKRHLWLLQRTRHPNNRKIDIQSQFQGSTFMPRYMVHFSFRIRFLRPNHIAGLHVFSLSGSRFSRHINITDMTDWFSWTAVRTCTLVSHCPVMSGFHFLIWVAFLSKCPDENFSSGILNSINFRVFLLIIFCFAVCYLKTYNIKIYKNL